MCISVQPVVDRLSAARQDLLVDHHVPFGVAQIGAKGAEATAIDADVGGVQVRVDIVVADVAVLPLADQIRQLADFLQRHLRIVKKNPSSIDSRSPGFDFVANLCGIARVRSVGIMSFSALSDSSTAPRLNPIQQSMPAASRITILTIALTLKKATFTRCKSSGRTSQCSYSNSRRSVRSAA